MYEIKLVKTMKLNLLRAFKMKNFCNRKIANCKLKIKNYKFNCKTCILKLKIQWEIIKS